MNIRLVKLIYNNTGGSMHQNTRDKTKQVKIHFLNGDQMWQQYAVARLFLDTEPLFAALKLHLTRPIPTHLLTIIPTPPLTQVQEDVLKIQLHRISSVEKIGQQIIAMQIQEWSRVLSFSFRDEDYCDIILQKLELNVAEEKDVLLTDQQIVPYIAFQLQQVHSADMIVNILASQQNFTNFISQAQQYMELQDSKQRRSLFTGIKMLILKGNAQYLKMITNTDHFPKVLQCLSLNYEFGSMQFNYNKYYQKTFKCTNLLNIASQEIIRLYDEVIKLKFLLHVATSMFYNQQMETAVNSIIHDNYAKVLEFISENPELLANAADVARSNPVGFIQLFSELWEMFKLIMDDLSTAKTKKIFKNKFVSYNLINTSLQTMKHLLQSNLGTPRLYQQYLEAVNPFLSHNWNQSQQLLLFLHQNDKAHLLDVLIDMLKGNDYNTKSVVLLFAKNLVQVTENRTIMKQAFLNYFYNEFVAPCVQYFKTIGELQILTQFFMKIYKFDLIRTRRSIFSSNLLQKYQINQHNKYYTILILKFLSFFLDFPDEGVFDYMARRNLFGQLWQKYHFVKKFSKNSIVMSLFLNLIKSAERSQNRKGQIFIHNVLSNPSQKMDIQE